MARTFIKLQVVIIEVLAWIVKPAPWPSSRKARPPLGRVQEI